MNISYNLLLIVGLGAASFGTNDATPQAISRWKKTSEGGSITIFHDHHGFDQEHPNVAIRHFEQLSSTLSNFSLKCPGRKLSALIECAFAAEYGNLMRKQAFMVPHYETMFLNNCVSFFNSDNEPISGIAFNNIECRLIGQLVNTYVGLSIRTTYGDFKNRPQTPQIKQLLIEYRPYIEKIHFKDIFTQAFSDLKSYKEESINVQFKQIFTEIETNVVAQAAAVNKILTRYSLSAQASITNIYDDGNLIGSLLEAMKEIDWEDLLLEMVDAHALYRIMKTDDADSAVVLAGFDHAKNIEKMLARLGYVRCYHEAYASPAQFPLSAYNQILITPKACGECFKEESQLRCGACKAVRYCSQDCQRKAWPQHKKVCKK